MSSTHLILEMYLFEVIRTEDQLCENDRRKRLSMKILDECFYRFWKFIPREIFQFIYRYEC